MKLSIVIVNYKTLDLTRKLLESIFNRQSGYYDQESEVIVVDNFSEDGCGRMIKKEFSTVKFIQTDKNLGFSGGFNLGIKQSKGEFILILNSDIEVKKDSLSKVISKGEKYNGDALIAGKLFFPDGSVQDSCFFLPTATGAFKEYFLGVKGAYFMFYPRGSEDILVEGAVAACWLIPRKIINKVGLLDEGTFIYFEDIDYCRRLKKAGISVFYSPECEFIHYHGQASKKMGVDKSIEYLKKASKHYHGPVKYWMLTAVLWAGQKLGRIKTPQSRWKDSSN